MSELKLVDILSNAQRKLKVPKNRKNDYSGWNYRSAEQILAEIERQDLFPAGTTLHFEEEPALVGEYLFTKVRAVLFYNGERYETTSFAGHPFERPGCDFSQCSGSSISYARKYALTSMFAISDATDDPDARDTRNVPANVPGSGKPKPLSSSHQHLSKQMAKSDQHKAEALRQIEELGTTFEQLSEFKAKTLMLYLRDEFNPGD